LAVNLLIARLERNNVNNEQLPNFSKIKIASSKDNNFHNNIRAQITEKELSNKIKNKRKLNKNLESIRNSLFDLTPQHWTELEHHIQNKTNNIIEIKTLVHNKKLKNLGIKVDLQVNCKFINKQRNQIASTELIKDRSSIFNLSCRQLNQTETQVLEKGLKYGIKNKRIDTTEILVRFEQLAKSLDKELTATNQDNRFTQLDNKNACLKIIQSMATEFIELSKEARDNLTDAEHKALENLAKDDTIIISKADKGNAVVIQNKSDYLDKVHKILQTEGKFKLLPDDPTIKREYNLQKYLRTVTEKKMKKAIPPKEPATNINATDTSKTNSKIPVRPQISNNNNNPYNTRSKNKEPPISQYITQTTTQETEDNEESVTLISREVYESIVPCGSIPGSQTGQILRQHHQTTQNCAKFHHQRHIRLSK